jgi:hypothetical protein
MAKRKTFEDAWNLVAKKGEDECWEWQGCKNSTGYGSMTVSQVPYSAHRIIFALTNPDLISIKAPADKKLKEFILHKCDNRTCCNPNHMVLGNYDDNNKDAKNKGRSNAPRGANHKLAKLTQDQANQVREIYKTGLTYVEIGKMFNIHANNISRIVRFRGYAESRM